VRRVIALALGLAAALPVASAAAEPSVRPCALGTSAADLRGFYAAELARAESRLRGGRRARRAFSAGVAAYVYGVPPLSVGSTVRRFPANNVISVARLVEPAVKTVVLPNHDTAYTVAQFDLSRGPLVIDVPDTAGRYYVLQLLDAYSNTFGYIGRRTTGTEAGSFALVPPGFSGALPRGVSRIESPTPLVWLLGRTLVRDEAEIPAIRPLLAGFTATPLERWAAGQRQASIVLPTFPPQPRISLPRGLAFFDSLGAHLRDNPPPRRDACALRVFAAAGIGPGRSPSGEARGPVRGGLEAARRHGPRLLSAAVRRSNAYSRRRNNGWLVQPAYVGSYGRNYLGRAVVARIALGANTREETVYPLGFTDNRGRPLSGRNRYTLRFERGQLPPAGAFWSLTMYDGDGYLYENPLRRYSIGDRTSGLRRRPDGSLTLFLQHRGPAGAARSNWLPAPRGRFRVALRLFEPRRSALSGAWRPPPLVRAE
jgi:hypothetical protein